MVEARRWIPILLLGGGIALVVHAVLAGRAAVALLVIVPVVYGASVELLLGIVLLFAGILTLPLLLVPPLGSETPPPLPEPRERPAEGGGGALVLLGPVPLFFGSWRRAPTWVRWAAAGFGIALTALAVVVVLGAL